MLIVSRAITRSISFGDGKDYLRFALTFPILRLFTRVKSTTDLVYTLAVIMPQFVHLFILLLSILHTYAIYGVLLFKDQFDLYLQDSAPPGNFNSLGNAMVTLFQLFVGSNWSEYACKELLACKFALTFYVDAAVKVKGNYAFALFFMSFILIVTILITNAIIAVILSVSARIRGMKNVSQHQINRSLLED
jgi:hypothetical protein